MKLLVLLLLLSSTTPPTRFSLGLDDGLNNATLKNTVTSTAILPTSEGEGKNEIVENVMDGDEGSADAVPKPDNLISRMDGDSVVTEVDQVAEIVGNEKVDDQPIINEEEVTQPPNSLEEGIDQSPSSPALPTTNITASNDTTSASDKGDAVNSTDTSEAGKEESPSPTPPVHQAGPFIDLLGPTLLSLEMINDSQAQLNVRYTNDALNGKKVVGLYFSADWCGPCRKFTPELKSFYQKMNNRRGRQNQFEIVWISRCKNFEAFGQYFSQMNIWLAMQPEDAMGKRGEYLSNLYKVKGIPTLVLLDEVGNVITTDARNKIPMDKAGIGFPWRDPLSSLYVKLVPKSFRLMMKFQVERVREKVLLTLKGAIGLKETTGKSNAKTTAARA